MVYAGRVNNLLPTVKSKSQLVYKMGFMLKKVMYQRVMTNAESLLETTYPPLKASNKRGRWHISMNALNLPPLFNPV